jgi:hypothetical protein
MIRLSRLSSTAVTAAVRFPSFSPSSSPTYPSGCQRETGSSFALNAVVEASKVTSLTTEPEIINTASHSGRGQQIARCPKCHIAVWSNYPNAGPFLRFIRVGTLENPDACSPDIHIFTASKQPWVVLDGKVPIVEKFYDIEKIWGKESLERYKALLPRIEEYKATLATEKLPPYPFYGSCSSNQEKLS